MIIELLNSSTLKMFLRLRNGWDAVCGYLQTKEQFDIYCYLPTHEGYSNLEYEEIAELRKTF
jgi:hypothetical protein